MGIEFTRELSRSLHNGKNQGNYRTGQQQIADSPFIIELSFRIEGGLIHSFNIYQGLSNWAWAN